MCLVMADFGGAMRLARSDCPPKSYVDCPPKSYVGEHGRRRAHGLTPIFKAIAVVAGCSVHRPAAFTTVARLSSLQRPLRRCAALRGGGVRVGAARDGAGGRVLAAARAGAGAGAVRGGRPPRGARGPRRRRGRREGLRQGRGRDVRCASTKSTVWLFSHFFFRSLRQAYGRDLLCAAPCENRRWFRM